MMLFGN